MSGDSPAQERLVEELTLLPGRVSRYFFLLATLDAQATRLHAELEKHRADALASAASGAPTAPEEEIATSRMPALREMYLAERRLLADKLFVERKAGEWVARAKSVVTNYHEECRRRLRLSAARAFSPQSDIGRAASQLGVSPDDAALARVGGAAVGGGGADSSVESVTSGIPKRRRMSSAVGVPAATRSQVGDGIYRKPSRASTGDIHRHRQRHRHELQSTDVPFQAGLIIKLGSQKGRPKKTSFTGSAKSDSLLADVPIAPVPPAIPTTGLEEEYFCPLCGKSEHANPSMVACDACDKWYHCACVGFIDDGDASKNFYCPICVGPECGTK